MADGVYLLIFNNKNMFDFDYDDCYDITPDELVHNPKDLEVYDITIDW